jgi:hypothetical protein
MKKGWRQRRAAAWAASAASAGRDLAAAAVCHVAGLCAVR